MPPPGHEPFLFAICQDPDDTVRLVYADWLDEHGDPDRAEFIRLQVAQAGKPRLYDADHFRAEALLKTHRARWLAELPDVTGIQWDDPPRRGFFDAIRAYVGWSPLARHERLFAAAPVQVLTLDWANESELARVLQIPELERLTELYLARCRVAFNRFQVLADCTRLPRLRALGIRGRANPHTFGSRDRANPCEHALTDAEARLFAETPHFPALREIYLDGTLSAESAQALADRYETVRYSGPLRHRPRDTPPS
jgi:uncharacterized protein (TIGR02996 family)